jgi:hypothetical protein
MVLRFGEIGILGAALLLLMVIVGNLISERKDCH